VWALATHSKNTASICKKEKKKRRRQDFFDNHKLFYRSQATKLHEATMRLVLLLLLSVTTLASNSFWRVKSAHADGSVPERRLALADSNITKKVTVRGIVIDNLCVTNCQNIVDAGPGGCAPDNSNSYVDPSRHMLGCLLYSYCQVTGFSIVAKDPSGYFPATYTFDRAGNEMVTNLLRRLPTYTTNVEVEITGYIIEGDKGKVTYAAGGDSLWCGGCTFNESALAAGTTEIDCALDGTAFNGVQYDGGIPSNQPFVATPTVLGTFTAPLISPVSVKLVEHNWGSMAASERSCFRPCLIVVHGFMMFFGWGVLIPLGVTTARYLKNFFPQKGGWFLLHRGANMLGLLLASGGFTVALLCLRGPIAIGDVNPDVGYGLQINLRSQHAIIGVTVMVGGYLQPLNAFFRPHAPQPGEPVPMKRKVWAYIHHNLGYGTTLLAMANIIIGISLAPTFGGDEGNAAKIYALKVLICISFLGWLVLWIFVLKPIELLQPKLLESNAGVMKEAFITDSERDSERDSYIQMAKAGDAGAKEALPT
jgi:hypothetical protein